MSIYRRILKGRFISRDDSRDNAMQELLQSVEIITTTTTTTDAITTTTTTTTQV